MTSFVVVCLLLSICCQLAAGACSGDVRCPATCQTVRNSDGCVSCNCTSTTPSPPPSCQDITCADNEVCELVLVQCFRAPCPPLPQCIPRSSDSEGGQSLPSLCTMPYEAGSCGHTHVRYYYDAGERTCKQFSYSGCLGNDNNFLNFVDCMTVCGRFSSSPSVSKSWTGVPAASRTPPPVTPDQAFAYCQLDADYGLSCKSADETAWFYNRTSGACEQFLFGGCLGNQNRFLSRSICHSVCVLRSVHPSTTPSPRQRTSPVQPRTRRTPSPTPYTQCPVVDCGDKDCSVGGFAKDAFGCTLCICDDPCQESPCPANTVCVRISSSSRATACVVTPGPGNSTPSATSASPPPVECPSVQCEMACVAGFVKDQNGCKTCLCVDPCQLVSCAAGSECRVEKVAVNTTACTGDMCGLPYRTHCVAVSEVSTPAASTVRSRQQFRSCCEREVTDPVCRRLCSSDSLTSYVDSPLYAHCLRYVVNLIGCVTDGVDRRQCCVSHGVSGICLDVCSGNRVSNPLQFLSCAQHLNSYASCYDIPLNRSESSTTSPVMTTSPVTGTQNDHFRSCCVTEGVSAYCHKLCSQRALWGASDADLLLCSSNLRTIAACATSGNNVTQCCASRGVTGSCLAICSGDVASFPTDVLQCRSHINSYYTCYNLSQSTPLSTTTPGRRCLPTNGCPGLVCEYGLTRDDAGCHICTCHEPCQDIECEEGSECTITSERVCELDMCHLEYSGQCTARCQTLNCTNPDHQFCRYGHVKNSTTGCDMCPCLEPCRDFTCEQGRVCQAVRRTVCHGGSCNSEYSPSCVVECPVFDCVTIERCRYGFARDANGCQTCACHNPCEGVRCPAGTVCQPSDVPIMIAENGNIRPFYTTVCMQLSTVSSPIVTRTRNQQFRSCCERELVSPLCRRLCSYDSLLSHLENPVYASCLNHLVGLVGCATGGIDRTQCCESKGVGRNCLSVCSGDVTSFPANLRECQAHMHSVASCYGVPIPTTTVAPTPVECPVFKCATEEACRYGFARDDNGCQICDCYDPCQDVACPAGRTCQVSNVQPMTSGNRTTGFTTTCIPKPGECPRLEPGMGGVCWEQCSTDADCSEDLKCCSNGCGHVCMAPGVSPTSSPSTTTVSRRTDQQFRSCCEREVTNSVCHQLCSYDSLLSNVDNVKYFVCLRQLKPIVGCAIGGVDRTQCCESKGVRGHCLGACSGNIADMPDNLFDCQTHLYSIASCYGVTPPPVPACPLVACDLYCEYGWEKDPYTGCDVCRCSDPCKSVNCPSANFRCEPVLRGESHTGICFEADPRINGVIKVAADFNVIDNEHKFKSVIASQIVGMLRLHEFLFKITKLRSGSILMDFSVSNPANVSEDKAVDILSHWTYEVELKYNEGKYTTTLLSYSHTEPPSSKQHSKNFLLMAVLIPVMVPVCLIVIVIVVILACKMQKVKRGLLSPSSRASSIAGDDSIASDNFKNGSDNIFSVSIDDSRYNGVSDA